MNPFGLEKQRKKKSDRSETKRSSIKRGFYQGFRRSSERDRRYGDGSHWRLRLEREKGGERKRMGMEAADGENEEGREMGEHNTDWGFKMGVGDGEYEEREILTYT